LIVFIFMFFFQLGRDTGEARRYRDQTSAYAPSACRRARVAS